MECTEVRDCGEYRHPTAGIGYAFLEFGHAGLARDLHDCEDGVHFGQVSFVVVLVNHDDAPTWTRSLFKACSAACKSVCQSLPQRRASMAHHARQSLGQVPVEEIVELKTAVGAVMVSIVLVPARMNKPPSPGAALPPRRAFHLGIVTFGWRGVRFCARFLPNTIVSDGDADSPVADLREGGTFARLA